MSPQARLIYILKPVGLAGPYKIGCSYAPVTRLGAFLHWSPIPLEIVTSFPGSLMLESNIHDCLAASHSHKEWFFATDKVRAFVAAMAAGTAIETALSLSSREGRVRTKGRPKTPPSRCLLTKWTMKIHHASVRARKEHGVFPNAPLEVEIELERLRRARGAVPAEFSAAPIERFLSDPIRYAGERRIFSMHAAPLPTWPTDVPLPAPADQVPA